MSRRIDPGLESLFETAPGLSVDRPVRLEGWRGRLRGSAEGWQYGLTIAGCPLFERERVVFAVPAGWSTWVDPYGVRSPMGPDGRAYGPMSDLMRAGIVEIACVGTPPTVETVDPNNGVRSEDTMSEVAVMEETVDTNNGVGTVDVDVDETAGFVGVPAMVRLELIDARPGQPRQTFEEAALEELAASIRQFGVLEPVTLHALPDGRFEIAMGERRVRASRLAGRVEIPAIVKEAPDNALSFEMAIAENRNRESLNAVDEGLAFRRLVEEFDKSHVNISAAFGVDPSYVSNAIRLLELPGDVRDLIRSRDLEGSHGRAILRFKRWPGVMSALGALVANARASDDPAVRRLASARALEKGVPFFDELTAAGLVDDELRAMAMPPAVETDANSGVVQPALMSAPEGSARMVEPAATLSLGMAADVSGPDVEVEQTSIDVEEESEGEVDEDGVEDSAGGELEGEGFTRNVDEDDLEAVASTGADGGEEVGDGADVSDGEVAAGAAAGGAAVKASSASAPPVASRPSTSTGTVSRPAAAPASVPAKPSLPDGWMSAPILKADYDYLVNAGLWPLGKVREALEGSTPVSTVMGPQLHASLSLAALAAVNRTREFLTTPETSILAELYPDAEDVTGEMLVSVMAIRRLRAVLEAAKED